MIEIADVPKIIIFIDHSALLNHPPFQPSNSSTFQAGFSVQAGFVEDIRIDNDDGVVEVFLTTSVSSEVKVEGVTVDGEGV